MPSKVAPIAQDYTIRDGRVALVTLAAHCTVCNVDGCVCVLSFCVDSRDRPLSPAVDYNDNEVSWVRDGLGCGHWYPQEGLEVGTNVSGFVTLRPDLVCAGSAFLPRFFAGFALSSSESLSDVVSPSSGLDHLFRADAGAMPAPLPEAAPRLPRVAFPSALSPCLDVFARSASPGSDRGDEAALVTTAPLSAAWRGQSQ